MRCALVVAVEYNSGTALESGIADRAGACNKACGGQVRTALECAGAYRFNAAAYLNALQPRKAAKRAVRDNPDVFPDGQEGRTFSLAGVEDVAEHHQAVGLRFKPRGAVERVFTEPRQSGGSFNVQ